MKKLIKNLKPKLFMLVVFACVVGTCFGAFADSICQLNCLATTQGEEQFLCLAACGMENAESGLEGPEVRNPTEKCQRDCFATKQGEAQLQCIDACTYEGADRPDRTQY